MPQPEASFKLNTAWDVHWVPHLLDLFVVCTSSSENRFGKCSVSCISSCVSMSECSLSIHHRIKAVPNKLMEKTFHQGRWNWLPMERSTFQVLWLALLVENLMGFSSTSLSSEGFLDAADLWELRARSRIPFSLLTRKIQNVLRL